MDAATDDSELLDLIYGAAVEPALWLRTLERFADRIGAWGGCLLVQNQETGTGEGLFTRIDPDTVADYFGYYATRNALLTTEDPRRFMRSWTPQILTDEDWIAKDEFTGTEYYNDFLRPLQVHSVLFIRLQAQGMEAVNFNLSRPTHLGQFSSGEVALAHRFQPHLIRAFRLGQQIGGLGQLSAGMAALLDRSPYGLILADAECRVRHANQAGEAMLAAGDRLGVVSGRLRAATPEATRRLRALVAGAASADAAKRTGGVMSLSGSDALRPISVTVAPMRHEQALMFDASPCVLVCAADLEAGVTLPQQSLRDLFGLTPAEAKVAMALFEGRSTREAAAHLDLSFFTVRAHLARIFAKTGVSSQPDLARLMMRAVGLG